MKQNIRKVMILILTLLVVTLTSNGQYHKLLLNSNFKQPVTVSLDEAASIANNQIARCGKLDITIKTANLITKDGELIAWLFDLEPHGYVVVPTSAILPAVMAYSFESDFGKSGSENPLFELLIADISNRLKYYTDNGLIARTSYANKENGNLVLSAKLFEQWPANGDGWLNTNWTQNSPYNDMCPMDPVTQTRSYAGCPSVAMAQILNFHENTNNTHFDDSDDYFHNYAGRQYSIDDDYLQVDFASFPQLNDYLDTLNQHWLQNKPLTASDEAALTFACGVACKQVYTSEGSGTFSVDQAYDAFLRFGFSTSQLLHENDTTLWDRLAQNIKDTLPSHLAVVDEAWQTGHNVVVDGYNSDDYYHINFGWGGTFNGWYLLPEEMPYGLTVVEGIILDIAKDTTVKTKTYPLLSCKVFPNPSNTFATITFPKQANENHSVIIYSSTGQLVETISVITGSEAILKTSSLNPGLYFFTLQNSTGIISAGKIIVN